MTALLLVCPLCHEDASLMPCGLCRECAAVFEETHA